jgi:hypothetical protein
MTARRVGCWLSHSLPQLTARELLPAGCRFRAEIVGYGSARDEHGVFTCYKVQVTRLKVEKRTCRRVNRCVVCRNAPQCYVALMALRRGGLCCLYVSTVTRDAVATVGREHSPIGLREAAASAPSTWMVYRRYSDFFMLQAGRFAGPCHCLLGALCV